MMAGGPGAMHPAVAQLLLPVPVKFTMVHPHLKLSPNKLGTYWQLMPMLIRDKKFGPATPGNARNLLFFLPH